MGSVEVMGLTNLKRGRERTKVTTSGMLLLASLGLLQKGKNGSYGTSKLVAKERRFNAWWPEVLAPFLMRIALGHD